MQNTFKEFLKDKKYMFSLILVIILSYGFMLTNYSVGIDDLSLNKYVSDTYILSAGRWGTWLTYNILQIKEFTPFWLDFIVVLILAITAIFCSCFFKKVSDSKLKRSSYIWFSISFISFPIISSFIVYQPTNLTVVISNLALIISIYFIYQNFMSNKLFKKYILIGILLAFPISMYESCCQTFVVVVFIVSFIYKRFHEDVPFKQILKFWITCFLVLLLGIVFNYLINLVIYFILNKLGLKRQNLANKKNILDVLEDMNMLKIIYKRKFIKIFASDLLFVVEFFAVSFLGLVIAGVESIKRKSKNLLTYIFIILSNFILLFFMLNNLYRVCYSWAITIGFIFLFFNEEINFNKKILKNILYVIFAYIILIQTKSMNNLFYNDYKGYQRDILYANRIIQKIQDKCQDVNKPLYFVEDTENLLKLDNLELHSDNRAAYFDWAMDSFLESQEEVIVFLNHFGYDFRGVENAEKAKEIYDNLQETEKQEEIIELEDFIVVNLDTNY